MKHLFSNVLKGTAFLLPLFAVFFVPRGAKAEAASLPETGILSSGSYVLEEDLRLDAPLEIPAGESVTLDLNGFTLSYEKGRAIQVDGEMTLCDGKGQGMLTGGGIWINGSLTMTGGLITGVSVEDNGAVNIGPEGSFTMTGGSILGNSAGQSGGGVYVGGSFSVSGTACVEQNTGRGGKENNVYLPAGKTISVLGGFAGRIGVTLQTPGGSVASGTASSNGFFSDDPVYTVVGEAGGLVQRLSPLSSVEIEFVPQGKIIYPTSKPEDLLKMFSLSYTNQNGTAYPEEFVKEVSLYVLREEEGSMIWGEDLSVGENDILIQAEGSLGEKAQARTKVFAVVPELVDFTLSYEQNGEVFFDSTLRTLYAAMNFVVTGSYRDGIERQILRTPAETAENSEESYISEYYSAAIDLSRHPGGRAQGEILVMSGETVLMSKEFTAEVSQKLTDLSAFRVSAVNVLEGDRSPFDASRFTPDLPEGISVFATLHGLPLEPGTLVPGIYTVELHFTVDESEHYKLTGTPPEGKLYIFERTRSGISDGISYEISCEEGISPEWMFSLSDVTKSLRVRLSDDLEMKQAVEITFFPGEDGATPEKFTVRIKLPESLQRQDLKLFRLRADGGAEETAFEREGEFLVFEAGELLQTSFLLAVNSNMRMYVILSVCFGILCVIGAAALLWYFISKRKLKLRG